MDAVLSSNRHVPARRESRRRLTLFVLVPLALGAVSAALSVGGLRGFVSLRKPALTPPLQIFFAFWALFYVLMGVSAWQVSNDKSRPVDAPLALWAVQLAMNALWIVLFFGLGMRFISLLWLTGLWAAALAMFLTMGGILQRKALLQLPYLMWLTFAGYLNLCLFLLNVSF